MARNKKNRRDFSFTPSSPSLTANPSITFGTVKDERPVFSFQHICQKEFCMKECSHEQFKGLADRLRIISSLTWTQLGQSKHEHHGYELIPQNKIQATIPAIMDKAEKVMVFRFGGGRKGGRIAGVRRNKEFLVLFIDSKFNLYDHG